MPDEPQNQGAVLEELAELRRVAEDRLATVTATVDQLQAEVDRRDDALLDFAAVVVVAAVAVLVADLLVRRGVLE